MNLNAAVPSARPEDYFQFTPCSLTPSLARRIGSQTSLSRDLESSIILPPETLAPLIML